MGNTDRLRRCFKNQMSAKIVSADKKKLWGWDDGGVETNVWFNQQSWWADSATAHYTNHIQPTIPWFVLTMGLRSKRVLSNLFRWPNELSNLVDKNIYLSWLLGGPQTFLLTIQANRM